MCEQGLREGERELFLDVSQGHTLKGRVKTSTIKPTKAEVYHDRWASLDGLTGSHWQRLLMYSPSLTQDHTSHCLPCDSSEVSCYEYFFPFALSLLLSLSYSHHFISGILLCNKTSIVTCTVHRHKQTRHQEG